jgi:hypothetical protein
MADELMSVQVEIHPGRRAASLRTAEQAAVELSRLGNVADLNGNVKWGQHFGIFARKGVLITQGMPIEPNGHMLEHMRDPPPRE